MTTVTSTPRPMPPQIVRTLRWLGRTSAVMALWFTGVVVALWVAAVVVAAQFGDLGQSMAQFSRQGMTWFPFSLGVTVFAACHTAHVAAGMTRRALGTATLIMCAANGLVFSLVVVGLFAAERVLYDANGWQHVIIDAGWFPAEPSDLLAILGWQVLVTTAAQVSGLLVAVTYQRLGAWRGTLVLPFTAGPIFAIWWLLGRGVVFDWLTTATRIGLSLVLTAAMAGAYLALLRRLQLRPARG